jgi:hypothetical protein
MDTETPKCGDCPLRKKAEENPKSFTSRLWKWHTGWCPGWKAYQVWLKEHPETEQSPA